jgi:hypothetical protein
LVERLIMENVWIVTTGSSDVQLHSNEAWSDWFYEIKNSIYRLEFEPSSSINEDLQHYRIPARVLGTAYEQLPDQVQPYLTFPLLANFIQVLQKGQINIDHIIVLVSDQEDIFSEEDRQQLYSPYWQDTCKIYPILEKYLQNQFPGAIIDQLSFKPQLSTQGLDDWDTVLDLVQNVFQDLQLPPDFQSVYVSHQAGTPAISSAVQFTSLSSFGEKVKFLVSTERSSNPTRILDSSRYLKGIRKKEAQKLLERKDYLGVRDLISYYLDDEKTPEIKILLKAAIEWNCAEFEKFKTTLLGVTNDHLNKIVTERSYYWWWVAYEEAYLAVVRKDQGNIVESFFHSFRAFEGIFAVWGNREFSTHIEEIKGISYLTYTALEDSKDYFSNQKCNKRGLKQLREKLEKLKEKETNLRNMTPEDIKKENMVQGEDRIELNFLTLCKLFRSCRYDDYQKKCEGLKIFWDNDKEKRISEKRNFIVHQIQGISETELWEFWDVSSPEEWEQRLLHFLNFIAEEEFLQDFENLKDVSLMSEVHKKLEGLLLDL